MNWKPQPPASANPALPTGRELFVCGSTSDACREFVEQSRRHNVSVISLPGESARQIRLPPAIRRAVAAQLNAALVTEGRALLHVGLPPFSRRGIGPRLTTHLAELAAATLHVGNVTHVFAEGGETAAALLRRMGWWRLSVTCELAPGVATLQPQGNRRLRLTIKPGSYRWPASLLAAFAVMATTAAWVSLRSALMA